MVLLWWRTAYDLRFWKRNRSVSRKHLHISAGPVIYLEWLHGCSTLLAGWRPVGRGCLCIFDIPSSLNLRRWQKLPQCFSSITFGKISTLSRSSTVASVLAECFWSIDTWGSLCQGTLKMLLYLRAFHNLLICSIVPTDGYTEPSHLDWCGSRRERERLVSEQCHGIQLDSGTSHVSVVPSRSEEHTSELQSR